MATLEPILTDELLRLGEKLQQSIALTKIRLNDVRSKRLQARCFRVVWQAEQLFSSIAKMAQASSAVTEFMHKVMNVSIDDLFFYTGKPKIARSIAYAGIATASDLVRSAINELDAINLALDKEVKHGDQEKDNQKSNGA